MMAALRPDKLCAIVASGQIILEGKAGQFRGEQAEAGEFVSFTVFTDGFAQVLSDKSSSSRQIVLL